MRYGFDISIVVNWLLPKDRRSTFDKAWITALLKPVETIHQSFIAKTTKWDDDIQYMPGYKTQLERMLQDRFHPSITIQTITGVQGGQGEFLGLDGDVRNGALFLDGDFRNTGLLIDANLDPDFTNIDILIPPAYHQDPSYNEGLLTETFNRFCKRFITFKIVKQ